MLPIATFRGGPDEPDKFLLRSRAPRRRAKYRVNMWHLDLTGERFTRTIDTKAPVLWKDLIAKEGVLDQMIGELHEEAPEIFCKKWGFEVYVWR